jgi:hypothetical protein
MKELKSRLVDKFLPDAPQTVIDEIEAELDKAAKGRRRRWISRRIRRR